MTDRPRSIAPAVLGGWILIFTLGAPASFAAPQNPIEPVADLNPQLAGGSGSMPGFLASDGTRTYFWAAGGDGSDDLWVSDGTPAGTHLIAPDLTSVSFAPTDLLDGGIVLPSGRVIVKAPTSVVPTHIWPVLFGTDGTVGGTEALYANTPDDLHVLSDLVEFQGEAWFVGELGPPVLQPIPGAPEGTLWRSDGTRAGTRPAFPAGVEPTPVTGPMLTVGGELYFVQASDISVAGDAPRILRTDGSGAAPAVVYVGPPDSDLALSNFMPSVGRILFTIFNQMSLGTSSTFEWWSIDVAGNNAETLANAFVLSKSESAVSGDRAYFSGKDAMGSVKVFISDGTQAGTAALPDNSQELVWPIFPTVIKPYKNGAVFVGLDPYTGAEPRFADANGVHLLVDAEPGILGSGVSEFVEWNGELYFHTQSTESIPGKLYRSDGTASGTKLVIDATAIGSAPLYAAGITQAGIVYRFDLKNGLGSEPWVVSGDTVKLVADIDPSGSLSSNPRELVRLGDKLVFVLAANILAPVLAISDGTTAGTQPIADADLLTGLGSIPTAVRLGDRALMRGGVGGVGRELLVTDGTAAGTLAVDLYPGAAGSTPSQLLRAGGRVWFSAETGPDFTRRLWVTDGTAAGTTQVADVTFVEVFGRATLFDAQGVGGADVFFVGLGAEGAELWRSDGTSAGTVLVADIAPGAASSSPRDGAVVGAEFCFSAIDAAHGREVWATDGSAAGTRLVADVTPGPASGVAVLDGVAFDGQLVVASAGGSLGLGPIAIEPVTGQVRRLVDPIVAAANPGLAGAAVGGFEPLADALLFATDGPTPTGGPARLWRATSATAFGEFLQIDVLDDFGAYLTDVGGGFALVGGVDASGVEPWVVRPIGNPTRLVDFFPGPASSSPSAGVRVGSRVLFTATDQFLGTELFKTSVATLGANVAEPFEGGCAAAGEPPILEPVGRPTLGANFDVRIVGAPASAPLVWVIDTGFVPASLFGPCAPLLPSPTFLALGQAGAGGVGLLDLAVPADPLLLDVALYFQTLVVEVPGPFLGIASLSDGLEVVVGP
ncbi:hypothetical protein [Engelhardtia mirabilis]|uniref:ELWxxDGT repeat protein n=1 Tax=Engelhardtia mirabilis TaxID=2528011 RepID=A0A518BDQ2_9BACT|nr:hypothetical protein Pla133_01750 [Planctomycetes bacterium Pla133]QDU99437.1 hypothetical protein Pla86_01750 [Planctomycetes bacterium Pla86]